MRKIYICCFILCAWLFSHSQCAQFINVDTSLCSGVSSYTVDATVLATQLCGDSITILFNSSTTGLDNDTNVYFHSGPQFTPFSGWQGAYTVGNWGQNDGVGRMTNVGTNLWSITINPRTYYNYPVDSCLDGIYMVFRNFNGDISVNYNNANIFVYTRPGPPTTTCPFVTPSRTENNNITYHWNDGNSDSVRTFTTGGNYTVTATGIGGCSATGSVSITGGSHAPVNLGGNITTCRNTGNITLNAGSGFTSYYWMGSATAGTSTFTANNPGLYWVEAVDNSGCATYDTITLTYSDVVGLSLPDTINSCPGNLVSLNAGTSVEAHGDSLSIIYDATQGQSGLVGAAKVYMHSGPSFGGQAWVGANTVGDWGLDDGVGEMDSIGNNHWEITINPYTYYRLNPDTVLTGISMVFRNANGSETGKDDNGNNIVLTFNGTQVTSSFAGVYAFHKSAGSITYNWSINNQTPDIAVSTTGTYIVTATDVNSCTATASSYVSFNNTITTSLPPTAALCGTASAVLTPGQGFASYYWSNTDTTSIITVNATGTYSVTVTNAIGCSASASTTVTSQASGLTVSISNGPSVVKCNTQPVTLSATSGFSQYLWFGVGPSSQTLSAVDPGTYWVEGIDPSGCVSYDTTVVSNSSVLGLSLPDTLMGCAGDTVHTNALVSINANGDSVVIVYDATQGVSGLVGSPKVYMHSGPEFHNGQGWVGAYTVGNWGQDNGVGEMTSVGSNLWSITIVPDNYYHLNPDTPLYGIYMVFRNADGSQTGKSDDTGNIFLQIAGVNPPTSPFSGVTATRKAALPLTFNWSNFLTGPIGSFTSGGSYTVTVTDGSGCTAFGETTVVDGQGIMLSLHDTTASCGGGSIMVNAPAGFSSYEWSTGASTQYLYVNTPGVYYLTVTQGSCSASDSLVVSPGPGPAINLRDTSVCHDTISINAPAGFTNYAWSTGANTQAVKIGAPGTYGITATTGGGCISTDTFTVDSCSIAVVGCGSPTAKFVVLSITPGNTVTLKDESTIAETESYEWSFGDGTTSPDTGSIVHTYANPGIYYISLVVRDSCGGVDSETVQVDVNYSGINSIAGIRSINVYPNPSSGNFNIDLSLQNALTATLSLADPLGRVVWTKDEEFVPGRNMVQVDGGTLAAGLYTIELLSNSEKTVRRITITK